MKRVLIYTDGACSGNPGPGGIGIIMKYGDVEKEISAGYKYTTNNRMELLSVIIALKLLKETCEVIIFTDSKYVEDSVNKKWLFNWEKDGFKNRKNDDLWKQFLIEYRKHKVSMVWVKGHSTNPYNNRCDVLAVSGYNSGNLAEDTGYKK